MAGSWHILLQFWKGCREGFKHFNVEIGNATIVDFDA